MSSINIRILEKTSDEDVEALTKLCTRAFGTDDRAVNAMTGNNQSLQPLFWRSMVRAASLEGVCYVVTEAKNSNEFRAVAIWYGPGHSYMGSDEQKKLGFNEFFEALSQETKDWWTKNYQPQFEKFLAEKFGPKKTDPFWYANCLATDPPYQNRGYGTALINAVFARAKKEKVPVSLSTQTSTNAGWYNSLGFRTVGKVDVSAPTGDFPAFLFIWGDEEKDQ